MAKPIIWMMLASVAALAAGACEEVEEANSCSNVCDMLRKCNDPDLDVDDCEEGCIEASDDDDALRQEIEACAECAMEDYTCEEVQDRCSMCDPVADDLAGAEGSGS